MKRRTFLAAVTALGSTPWLPAQAAAYPIKPIRLVVPFAAGSATDSVGRILAQELSRRLGQQVMVENRPGAFGQIAAQAVTRSAADGYTLFMTTNTTHGANPHLFHSLSYDPIRDYVAIARLGTLPFMLVVTPSLPVKTTAELLDYARKAPDALSYAQASSASLVAMETIKHMAGVSITGVQYKASPQAIVDLIAGRVQVMMADFATAMSQVRGGKLRVLAVTTGQRSRLLPQIPSIAETLPGFDITSWNGVFAPAKTPPAVVSRLEREILASLAQPEVAARLEGIGFEVDAQGSATFRRYVNEQIAHWGRLIRAAGIEPQ
ncbi:MAG: tripartite tricarboxylate transporter substrate binding protein [Burkholderiales bacterium]|nr:tripartite tricarboxylate transporter substrate binding protein [Burkholderiales bacterium]